MGDACLSVSHDPSSQKQPYTFCCECFSSCGNHCVGKLLRTKFPTLPDSDFLMLPPDSGRQLRITIVFPPDLMMDGISNYELNTQPCLTIARRNVLGSWKSLPCLAFLVNYFVLLPPSGISPNPSLSSIASNFYLNNLMLLHT